MARNHRDKWMAICLLGPAAVLTLPSCARFEKAGGVEGVVRLVMNDLRDLRAVLLGAPNPKIPPNPAEAARQANAELLNEVFQVVLLRAPLDEVEFGVFLGTLTQGASLEGVYNGFTHSAIYRNKEMKYGPASAEALKAFVRLISELQEGQATPTLFDSSMARPLAEFNLLQESDGVSEVRLGQAKAATTKVSGAASAELMQVFEGASLYTLKRVAGDEALKVINHHQQLGTLASWYGAFAARQAASGVDFGLELRNKADEAFHKHWADRVLKSSQQDRLIWEVLNRVHRTINRAELLSRSGEKK